MSDNDLPELSPELRRLLQAGRPGAQVPKADQEHLAASIGAILGHALPPPDVAGPSAAMSLAKSKAAIGIGALIVGAVLGATGHAILAPATPPAASSSIVVIAPAPPASSSAPIEHTAAPPPVSASAKVDPALPAPSRVGTDTDLNAERALIDVARAALGRDQPAAAMETLKRHAARFPHGRLAEEREALWVRALAMSGKGDVAREREDEFRKRYPDSLLLPPSSSAPSAP